MDLKSRSGTIKILLIESDRKTEDRLNSLFVDIEKETDFSILDRRATSFQQAREILKKTERFDVILLDLFQQKSDSIETSISIKRWNVDLPIVVLGDNNTSKFYRQVLETGAQDYLCNEEVNSQLLIRSLTYAIAQHQTQNALHQSEEKYRLFTESIKEVVFQIDRAGNWLFLNTAWTKITGFSVRDSLGKPAIASFHPEDIVNHEREFNALISGEKTKSVYNLRCYHADRDRYCDIEMTALPIFSPNEEILGISGTFTDLTDYRQQERRLQTITLQRDRLVQNVPATIYQLCQDTTGNYYFAYVSQGSQILFELDPQTIINNGEAFFDLLSTQDRDRFFNALNHNAKTLQPWELEFCAKTRSGKQKWLKGFSQPEKQQNGDILWDGAIVDITPLKQTENSLLQQQELLLKIIQTSPNAWYFYDLKHGKYLYLNQCLIVRLGYSVEEFYQSDSQLHFQLTHPDDLKQLEIYLEQIANGKEGEIFSIEYRMRHKNGQWYWFLSRDIVFACESDGQPKQVLGTMTEINELKEIENQLQENQSRLQLALENTKLGLWDWNLQTGEVFYNKQWKQLTGYREEELAGDFSAFEKLVHPEDLPQVLKIVEDYIKSHNREKMVQIDFRMQTKQGNWKWFVSQGKVITWDGKGNPLQFLGTTKDISDRKQIELELRLLLSAAQSINRAKDFQDAIAMILPLFCQTIGWDVAEAWIPIDGGKNLKSVPGGYVSQSNLQDFLNRSQEIDWVPNIGFAGKIYNSQKPEWIEDIAHVQKRDFYRKEMAAEFGLKACLGIPIIKNKRVLAILLFFKKNSLVYDFHVVDIVNVVAVQLGEFMQRKQAEEKALSKTKQLRKTLHQLKRSQVQAIHNEKMVALGQLIAGIAHEINNPISFIYGNITPAVNYVEELLALIHIYQKHYPHPVDEIEEMRENIDLEFMIADFLKLLESMKTGANRIRKIVESLRNFSRLDESDRKSVNLYEGLNNTLMLLQHRLKPQGDRPEIQVVKTFVSLPEVECYPGDINQVFMNLLSNAIDSLEEKWLQGIQFIPTLTLNTEIRQEDETQPAYICIHFGDNGMGIPSHLQSRIFDPFFTTKSVGKGTGLGLTTSHDIIVEKHDGKLYFASEAGKGTKFTIALPVQQ